MDSIGVHRPRNVDWRRAAALLYGDWGTSKAYVIGAAFLAATYASLPIILAVCALTGLVGYNYVVVCKQFPDGGGVYSSARLQSRFLAVLGSLLLVADLTVTASLSGWSAMAYFHVPKDHIAAATVGLILFVGAVNYFGPKHTGSVAVWLALPAAVVVVAIILMSLPHLTLDYIQPSHKSFAKNWTAFVGVILALSGVEAIANLTGVMKLDPGTSLDSPMVGQTARKAILTVAVEVVLGTAMLGWAMLSLPPDVELRLLDRWDDMLTVLAEQYGALTFTPALGRLFGLGTAVIVGLLLLSAVNTAVGALIGLLYLLARDGEMPRPFARLNSHGVPWVPLFIATLLPTVVVAFSPDQISLMELYAIGVVGAITVNLGSCAFNKNLKLLWYERALFYRLHFDRWFRVACPGPAPRGPAHHHGQPRSRRRRRPGVHPRFSRQSQSRPVHTRRRPRHHAGAALRLGGGPPAQRHALRSLCQGTRRRLAWSPGQQRADPLAGGSPGRNHHVCHARTRPAK